MSQVKRNYKDGMFRRIFSDKEKIIELYSALSGRSCGRETEVEIVTLDDAVYGGIKNDLAFIIDGHFIILIEHQSTVSPNIPLRMLSYIVREYEQRGFTKKLYSKRHIKIPVPEFYIFYNGPEEQPLRQELKLSDAFLCKCDKISLEAKVEMININYHKGAKLLKKCGTLAEYSRFIDMIRSRQKEMNLNEAVEESIRECMKEGILEEFLKRNGGDIMNFVRLELTREECEAIREEDGYMRGLDEGIIKGRKEGRKAGLDEGRSEEQIKIARNMKEMGMEEEIISRASGLTEEQVRKL